MNDDVEKTDFVSRVTVVYMKVVDDECDTVHGGGRITVSDNVDNLAENAEDFFVLMEEKCTHLHKCGGRVKNKRLDMNESCGARSS